MSAHAERGQRSRRLTPGVCPLLVKFEVKIRCEFQSGFSNVCYVFVKKSQIDFDFYAKKYVGGASKSLNASLKAPKSPRTDQLMDSPSPDF